MCGDIAPEHGGGLGFRVDQLTFGGDVGAQELVDGAGDGVAEDGGVLRKQEEVLVIVEEGGLDEDGGHGGAAQHGEVGVDLDAAVGESPVEAADGAVYRPLHDGREPVPPGVLVERVCLAAAATACVGVDRDEDVGRPVIGERRDVRVGGCLAAQVVALHGLCQVAVALECDAAVLRDARVDFGFGDIVLEIDCAGIRSAAECMAWVDEDTHIALLSYSTDVLEE